jgi:hypothetical protein
VGAYNPYQALANAVLEMAKSDWKYYEDNEEVEAFLQGDLIDFYLNLADIDKGSYLAEVRSQRLRWRRPKKAGVSNYEAQEIKAETCGDPGGGLHAYDGNQV